MSFIFLLKGNFLSEDDGSFDSELRRAAPSREVERVELADGLSLLKIFKKFFCDTSADGAISLQQSINNCKTLNEDLRHHLPANSSKSS